MQTIRRWSGLVGVLLLGISTACGGGGASLTYNPDEATPTLLISSNGRITASIPVGALSESAKVVLTDRTDKDAAVPGPEGRTLMVALELVGTATETTPAESGNGAVNGEAQNGTENGNTTSGIRHVAQDETDGETPGDTTETDEIELTLSAAVEITYLPVIPLAAVEPLAVYTYNAASERYEEAGISATVAEDGSEITFSITEFGRYALYNLLPEEIPPAPPTGLELLAASTQVRKLQWHATSDPLVVGYNLYRSPLGEDNFTKANTDTLTVTTYVDELADSGGYQYHLTVITEAGLESDPSAAISSPAIDFDLYFTFGQDVLQTPGALAIHAAAERLLVADPAARRIHIFGLMGQLEGEITYYANIHVEEPLGLAVDEERGWYYITDAQRQVCYILEEDGDLAGAFGGWGAGPGEFLRPAGVVVTEDKVLVADVEISSIQSFTPRGVYLTTIATAGLDDGLFDSPVGLFYVPAGSLYACDPGNARVQVFNADLEFESLVELPVENDGPLNNPTAVTQDFREQLYVSDSDNRRVVVFDSSGEFLFHFGSPGSLIVEFGLSGPQGLALDRTTGYLYVCDPTNQRIAVFRS